MRTRATFMALLLATLPLAWSPPSAENLVGEIVAVRNQFEVNLSSWIDRDADTSQPWLYLDVAVVKNTEEQLTALTVLVEQLDPDLQVLAAQRVPIDVSDMDVRGLSKTYGLEVRPMAPGVDGIRLIIERDPPMDAWSEFPELDRVRPRGQ